MHDNKSLSKSAQSVQNSLMQKGVACEVVELSSSTRTAQDAANSLGCDVAQIVKSLLFRTQQSNQPILILASGVNRVDEQTIEALVQEKMGKADADFTREVTGFAIGGVPPVGHKNPIAYVFIDEDLMGFDKLWAAAGTPNAVFSLSPAQLKHLTEGTVVKISK